MHDNGGMCSVSGSAVPWTDGTAVRLIAVRTGSLYDPVV